MFCNVMPAELSSHEIAFLDLAIARYTDLLENGSIVDLVVLNSRGVCKLTVGVATHQQELIDSAIEDFLTVIMLAPEKASTEYLFAKSSLILAYKANAHLTVIRTSGVTRSKNKRMK